MQTYWVRLLKVNQYPAQKGLKSISGKKWLNSIMMTAVRVNQIAENTGAVVRNFFMVLEVGAAGGMSA